MSRSSITAAVSTDLKPVGLDGNPEVSGASRFEDEVWDFSNENRNPAIDRGSKMIHWAFGTPDGSRFTDPVFRHLLRSFKQFLYALRWHPVDESPLAASAVVTALLANEAVRRPPALIQASGPQIQGCSGAPL